jgi:hypothetical protein
MMHGLANVKYILDIDFTNGLSLQLPFNNTHQLHASHPLSASSANKEIPDIL